MAKSRKGRHNKGPGGPKRTSHVTGSTGFTPVSTNVVPMPVNVSRSPEMESLVDSFLGDLPAAEDLLPIQIALNIEHSAGEIYGVLENQSYETLGLVTNDIGQALARRRSADADRMLAAFCDLAAGDGEVAFRRVWERRLAEGADDPIALAIGQDRPLVAYEIGHEAGDGVTLLLGLENPLGAYTAGVYVDHNLGGLAKDLLIGPPLAEALDAYERGSSGMLIRGIGLAEAAARARRAINLGMDEPDVVSDTFWDDIVIVSHRFELCPFEPEAPEPDLPSSAERRAHVQAFLAAPEAWSLTAMQRTHAPEILRAWIHFAVEETVGGPRRVSGGLVELFCLFAAHDDVAGDVDVEAAAMPVIAAWLRFAARTTDLHPETLDVALAALAHFGPAMSSPFGDDPDETYEAFVAAMEHFEEEGHFLPIGDEFSGGPQVWEPLQSFPVQTRVHLDVDPSAVPDHEMDRTRVIAFEAAQEAAMLLGPSFAHPAAELAVLLGSADPCPFPKTQLRTWVGTVVWVLAEDNGAFDRSTVGRRRDDLAHALTMTRSTYETKAKVVRSLLGLAKGDLRVAWERER